MFAEAVTFIEGAICALLVFVAFLPGVNNVNIESRRDVISAGGPNSVQGCQDLQAKEEHTCGEQGEA